MTMLVLGIGHPDRGDDAAGPLVAAALEDVPGVVARGVTSDPSAILTDPLWDTAAPVYLVDTVRTGSRPGTVHRWSGARLRAHLPATGGGTHDLGIATTLQLAAALDRLPPQLTVIGVEGSRFDLGAPPSRPVRHAIAIVAASLAREAGQTDGRDTLEMALHLKELQITIGGGERRQVRIGEG